MQLYAWKVRVVNHFRQGDQHGSGQFAERERVLFVLPEYISQPIGVYFGRAVSGESGEVFDF